VVVESDADLDAVPAGGPLCVVAQSTQNREFFEAVVAKLRARGMVLAVETNTAWNDCNGRRRFSRQ